MEKTYQIIYFFTFIVAFVMMYYLLLKSNFEKCFKQGKIQVIKVAMFLVSFVVASLFAFGMKSLMESIYTIIK